MKSLFAPWRLEYVTRPVTGDVSCIFCQLFSEQSDAENLILARSAHCVHILNRFPYAPAHLMVLPVRHVSSLSDLTPDEFRALHDNVLWAHNALMEVYRPQGLNLGMNLGKAAGAGIEHHLHYHLVPRWVGDTNFMPLIGETKVISGHLRDTYDKLKPYYEAHIPSASAGL